VAAIKQPVQTTPSMRRPLVACAAVLVALALPGRAAAHGTTPVSSLDYEARITSVSGAAVGVRTRVIDGDRQLELRVSGPHTVVVLGYGGEPFLRFSPNGVDVNDGAATAIANGLARRGAVPALAPGATPAWRHLTGSSRFRWHDHRIGPLPGRHYGAGDVARWSIPVVVDGVSGRIAGRLWHAHGPSPWPWVGAIAAVLALVAGVALRAGRGLVRGVILAGTGVSCAGAVLLGVALSLGGQGASGWSSVGMTAFVAGTAAAVYVAARRSPYAVVAPGLAALYTGFVGLGNIGVLVHGYVVSALPASAVRAAAAATVCAGLGTAAAAAVEVVRIDRGDRPAAGARLVTRTMTVPRGRRR
jgi:hypothetical protein